MIILKNDHEIEYMRESGRIVGETLLMLEEIIAPGITTAEIDKLAEEFITKQGAKPSFKGYGGFPGSICASVNETVVHGIPSKSIILKDGDIISVDCGAYINGFHGDAARTFLVGNVSEAAKQLVEVTEKSFFKGVEKAIIGNRIGDIAHEIQEFVESYNYSIVRDYVGHGIGRNLHEDPSVPNYGKAGKGPRLLEGMVLAIEPMVNMGKHHVKTLNDGWTVVTSDRSLSAHYENTIAISPKGLEILTLIK